MLEPVTPFCGRCGADFRGAYSHRGSFKDKEWVSTETICLDCDKGERLAEYRHTRRLSMKTMLDASFWKNDYSYLHGWGNEPAPAWMQESDRADQRARIAERLRTEEKYEGLYREIIDAEEILRKGVKAWEQAVWFGGLQKYYRKSKDRGHAARAGDLKMLVWGCAGRVMVTLHRDDDSVTVLCDESSTEPRSGLHGIDATRDAGVAILFEAAAHAKQLLKTLKSDNKVSMV